METGADIIALWPRWMDSAAEMLRMNALVRTRCSKCGTLLRVELDDVVARHGPGYSLVDRLDRWPDGRLHRIGLLSRVQDLRA